MYVTQLCTVCSILILFWFLRIGGKFQEAREVMIKQRKELGKLTDSSALPPSIDVSIVFNHRRCTVY